MPKKVIIPIENYKTLGCAIIKAAVDDYIQGDLPEGYFKKFLYETLWIKCLNVDVDWIFEKAKERHDEKEERKAKRIMEYRRSKGMD
jgi:hypothetical protein